MSQIQSLMLTEAGQSPDVVATLLEKEKPVFAEIARPTTPPPSSNISSKSPAVCPSPRSARRSPRSMARPCI